jgi:signal transduction histidine kinase
MFKQAVFRLTLWYLLLILSLSAIFSLVLYNSSTNELNNLQIRESNLLRAGQYIGILQPINVNQLNRQRLDQIDESARNIALNLIYFNLIIIIIGGELSYLLAKYTLKPIEEALENQKRFTADASHELRTPLTAMKTEIEVNLRDSNLSSEEARSLLSSNLEEIDKLEILTNGLLALSKHDLSKAGELEKLELKPIMEKAIEQISPQAEQKKITLENNFQPTEVSGIKASLTELLVILLDNAVKYSPPETIVKFSNQIQDHQTVIKVEDQGIGIKSTDLPYIFNRFYRADHSRSKEKVNGYGLGLSIAKQIVEAHNAKIEVKSTPNEGTTFSVRLALAKNKPKK